MYLYYLSEICTIYIHSHAIIGLISSIIGEAQQWIVIRCWKYRASCVTTTWLQSILNFWYRNSWKTNLYDYHVVPRLCIGDVKITSRIWWPSSVTKGKSPPIGPACPEVGLLHTLKLASQVLHQGPWKALMYSHIIYLAYYSEIFKYHIK